MKTALFTNFTNEEFIGWWDGKGKRFAPGDSLYMPDYLARHFAKHLVNRELLRVDSNGNYVHKDGDKMTSPKKPDDVPMFMELFNKAYTPDELEELGDKRDDIDALIGAANKNRDKKMGGTSMPTDIAKEETAKEDKPQKQDPTQPQVIVPPDFDDDEDDK